MKGYQPVKNYRQALGKWGESLAEDYLQKHAYEVLARNARTTHGEIDLVARQHTPSGPVTVFIEVKTRRSTGFGPPEEAVTLRKQAHLLAAAQAYLQENPALDGDWRVDVIAIQRLPGQRQPEITHFENAIQ